LYIIAITISFTIYVEYSVTGIFLRPDSLATDNASSVDVVLHAMNHANKLNQTYEYIGLLEPTSPFISIEDLDGSIDLIEKNKEATAIVAVKESRPHKIFIQKNSKFLDELAGNLDKVKKLSRQNFTKEITPSGGFYIARWDSFLQSKTFYTNKTLSFEVDEFSGIEIDEILDWEFAEFLILKQSEIEK
jgi:N-acylneuraminate cytidylyltransferase/CMP-N,N'-diacetyllegionaminic acid synthase